MKKVGLALLLGLAILGISSYNGSVKTDHIAQGNRHVNMNIVAKTDPSAMSIAKTNYNF